MNKKEAIENRVVAPVYVDEKEIMGMFSVCRQTARRIGLESGGAVKIGRSTRYNVEKVKEYFAQNSI